jgi:hypothetical protein
LGRHTCHKYGKPGHFQWDCPDRQLYHLPTPRDGCTTVVIDDDGDVIVCVSEEDVYDSVSDGTVAVALVVAMC